MLSLKELAGKIKRRNTKPAEETQSASLKQVLPEPLPEPVLFIPQESMNKLLYVFNGNLGVIGKLTKELEGKIRDNPEWKYSSFGSASLDMHYDKFKILPQTVYDEDYVNLGTKLKKTRVQGPLRIGDDGLEKYIYYRGELTGQPNLKIDISNRKDPGYMTINLDGQAYTDLQISSRNDEIGVNFSYKGRNLQHNPPELALAFHVDKKTGKILSDSGAGAGGGSYFHKATTKNIARMTTIIEELLIPQSQKTLNELAGAPLDNKLINTDGVQKESLFKNPSQSNVSLGSNGQAIVEKFIQPPR